MIKVCVSKTKMKDEKKQSSDERVNKKKDCCIYFYALCKPDPYFLYFYLHNLRSNIHTVHRIVQEGLFIDANARKVLNSFLKNSI